MPRGIAPARLADRSCGRSRRDSLAAYPLRGKRPLRLPNVYHLDQVKTLVRRTLRDLWANDVLALAAQTAFWCFFSLFPILLFSASVLSLVGDRQRTFERLLNTIAPAAPGDAMALIEHVLHDVVFVANAPGLLSVGAALAIWTG